MAAATLLLAVWTALAARQTATWKNSFTVFEHAIAVSPDNFFAHNHLGLAYHNIGDMEKAGAEYAKAVKFGPDYDSANGNLGVYYASKGEIDKAIECFRKASHINPYLASFHANLGTACLARGKLEEAEDELRKAAEIDANNPAFHGNLGLALRLRGKTRRPAEHHKMLSLCPNDAVRLSMYSQMLRMCPNDVVLVNDAAWLLATSREPAARNGKDAVALARRAVELTGGQEPTIFSTLAAAYAEDGQFAEATETAQKPGNWPRGSTSKLWRIPSRPRSRSTKPGPLIANRSLRASLVRRSVKSMIDL